MERLKAHGGVFLFACAALCVYSAQLTNLFTGDDMVHYFQNDYRLWIQGFSNHGRLGQGALVLCLQAVGFNLVRQQILGRVLAIAILSAAAYVLYASAEPHLREPSARRLGALGCFLAVFNLCTIELLSYSMAALTYAVSLLFSVLGAARLAGGFDRRRLLQAFMLMFAAFWFYQNTPPYFVGFSLFFIFSAGMRDGESPKAVARKAGIVLGMYLTASLINLLYVTKIHGLLFHTEHTARVSLDLGVPLRMIAGIALRTGWLFLNDYGLPTGFLSAALTLGACALVAVGVRRDRWGVLPFTLFLAVVVALSVIPNALNAEYYVPARSIPAIGGLLGCAMLFAAARPVAERIWGLLLVLGLVFLLCVALDSARVAAAIRVSNRLDVERAKRICRLIAEGERAQHTVVKRVYFVPDARLTAVYPSLSSFSDTSLSLLATVWSRASLLRFVSGRQFEPVFEGADAGVVVPMQRGDWTPFVDPEQVVVRGDAAYIALY